MVHVRLKRMIYSFIQQGSSMPIPMLFWLLTSVRLRGRIVRVLLRKSLNLLLILGFTYWLGLLPKL